MKKLITRLVAICILFALLAILPFIVFMCIPMMFLLEKSDDFLFGNDIEHSAAKDLSAVTFKVFKACISKIIRGE